MEDKYYYTKNLLQFLLAMFVNVLIVIFMCHTLPGPNYFLAHFIMSIGVGIVFWVLGYVGAGVGLIFFFPFSLLIGIGMCLSIF